MQTLPPLSALSVSAKPNVVGPDASTATYGLGFDALFASLITVLDTAQSPAPPAGKPTQEPVKEDLEPIDAEHLVIDTDPLLPEEVTADLTAFAPRDFPGDVSEDSHSLLTFATAVAPPLAAAETLDQPQVRLKQIGMTTLVSAETKQGGLATKTVNIPASVSETKESSQTPVWQVTSTAFATSRLLSSFQTDENAFTQGKAAQTSLASSAKNTPSATPKLPSDAVPVQATAQPRTSSVDSPTDVIKQPTATQVVQSSADRPSIAPALDVGDLALETTFKTLEAGAAAIRSSAETTSPRPITFGVTPQVQAEDAYSFRPTLAQTSGPTVQVTGTSPKPQAGMETSAIPIAASADPISSTTKISAFSTGLAREGSPSIPEKPEPPSELPTVAKSSKDLREGVSDKTVGDVFFRDLRPRQATGQPQSSVTTPAHPAVMQNGAVPGLDKATPDTTDLSLPSVEFRTIAAADTPPRLDPVPHRPETPAAIARQLTEHAQAAQGRVVELRLDPQELGRVRMSLSSRDEAIAVTIVAERPETLALMRRHIDTLSREFLQIGYASVSFSFDGQSGTGSHKEHTALESSAEFTAAQPTITPTPATTPPITPSGGLDLRL